MKKDKILGYILMILGVACSVVMIVGRDTFPLVAKVVLSILFSSLFSVGYVKIVHNRLLEKDDDYSVETKDERNVRIKEKTGNAVNMVNLVVLGLITIIFIALEYYIPAIVIWALILLQPIIMILISNYFERKF